MWFVVLAALALLIFFARTLGVPAGLRFGAIQAIATPLMVIGWVLLIPICIGRRYSLGADGKWHFSALLWIFDNDEDGVMPTAYNPEGSAWLVYLWTAWRNSVNNLRYLFLWKGGPLYRWENGAHTWYYQHGFRADTGWPVWSAGRI